MSESVGPRPAQLRIVDDIRARIDSGELPPGAKLPSTRALMAQFGVSTQTVQRAIGILKSEGIVESRSGAGVFVRPQRKLVSSVRVAVDEQPLEGSEPLMTSKSTCRPSDEIAEALGLRAHEEARTRQTHWVAEHRVVEIRTSYYPPAVAGGTEPFENAPPVDGSIEELRRLGYSPHHATELVHTRMPTPYEAAQLRLSPGVAVLRVLRRVVAEDGQVLEVLDSTMSGDRHQLLYELPIHD